MENVRFTTHRFAARKLRVFTAVASICLVSIFLTSCATVYNPVTRREERTLYTVEQEIALGKQVATQVEAQNKISLDRADYVRGIGQRVASSSDRPDLPYSFKIVDAPQINAFALPGGYIYIYKGLLDIINEDELSAVLGHEVGHVAARHGIKRIQAVFGYQLVALVALSMMGNKPETAQVQKIADDIFTLVILGYSREDEMEADRLGTTYSYRSGHNPRAMLTLLEKLAQQERGPQVVYLSTHPLSEDRIKNVEIVIAALESEKAQ